MELVLASISPYFNILMVSGFATSFLITITGMNFKQCREKNKNKDIQFLFLLITY